MNAKELAQEFMRRANAAQLQVEVLGDGNVDAEIAVVAEYPGQREVELRTPLVGGSGKFLWDALRHIGVSRSQCYVTNVVKKQVASSENERFRVSPNELDHWAGLLRWELDQLHNLRYVLVLGTHALYAVHGTTGIEKWRGSCIQDDRGRWYIFANNPAHILRSPSAEPIFQLDIHKLDLVRKGQYRVPVIEAHYNPTPREAIEWITRLHDEREPISLDIETIAKETACVGLANSVDRGMCINFRDFSDNRWGASDEHNVRMHLARLLGDPNTRIVAQNGSFDAGWLYFKDRIRIHRTWFDTLLAHHTLYPTLPHGLGFLTAQYTHHPYYKNELDEWREGGDIRTFWEYNVKDVCITLMVQRAILHELRQQKLDDFFFNHVMRLQPHLIDMTACGVKVDLAMKEQLKDDFGREVASREDAFVRAARRAVGDEGFTVNPRSPKQLAELFFDRLRLVSRTHSTDRASRTAMLQHPRISSEAKDVILELNRFAEAHKFLSTYVNTTIDDDGRIRSEYKQYGTQTAPGRLSSSKTLWGSGCVPLDAEALTPIGWVPIAQQPPQIAQYNEDGSLEFVSATWNVFHHQGDMYTYYGRNVRGMFTPEHRIVATKRDKLYVRTAAEIAETTLVNVPCCGMLDNGAPTSHAHLRVWIMASADGSVEGRRWRVRVKKQRKAYRAAKLLNQPLPESDRRGYYSFSFQDAAFTKRLPNPLLLDAEARHVMLDELQHWDAHVRGSSFIYYTTIPQNAEYVQLLAHITNHTASITINHTNSNEYGNTASLPLYMVNVSPKQTNALEAERWDIVDYDGEVGCPTVPSGMWLMRYKGGIHITGNSNMQNQPVAARPMYVADDGYVWFYFDLSQAEARVVAYEAQIAKWIEQFERARVDGSYDAHRALASEMFNIPYDDVPKSDVDEHGKHTIRYTAKRCRHGLNYRMMPDRLAEVTGMPIREAERNWTIYHRITPELQRWWKDLEHEVRTSKMLFNALGRRLYILGPISEETLEPIVAFKPQSVVGDKVCQVIYQSHDDARWPRDARILLNVHDSLSGICKPSDAKRCLAICKHYAEQPLVIRGQQCIIPADCAISEPDDQGIHRWSNMRKVKMEL